MIAGAKVLCYLSFSVIECGPSGHCRWLGVGSCFSTYKTFLLGCRWLQRWAKGTCQAHTVSATPLFPIFNFYKKTLLRWLSSCTCHFVHVEKETGDKFALSNSTGIINCDRYDQIVLLKDYISLHYTCNVCFSMTFLTQFIRHFDLASLIGRT